MVSHRPSVVIRRVLQAAIAPARQGWTIRASVSVKRIGDAVPCAVPPVMECRTLFLINILVIVLPLYVFPDVTVLLR